MISAEMLDDLCDKFKDEIYALNVSLTIGSGTASIDEKEANISLLGNSIGYYITNKLDMVGGAIFTKDDIEEKHKVAIVSDKLVNKLFDGDNRKALGREIPIEVTTSEGNFISVPFTIIGIYKQEDIAVGGQLVTGDDTPTNVFIPLKTGLDISHKDYAYPYIQVISKVGSNPDELCTKMENFFGQYYKSNPNFEVKAFTLGSMVSMLEDLMGKLTLAISIVAGIALLVGGIGVMNIMLVSITERTREIGTRKALGAKNSSIRIQFIVEAMIICLIGGAIGIMVGIAGGALAAHILGAPAHPSLSSIFGSLLFSMAIGVFFGYYPANKAAKMNPIDALRYE